MSNYYEQSTAQKLGSIVLGIIVVAFAIWTYFWSLSQNNAAIENLDLILLSVEDKSQHYQTSTEDNPYVFIQGQAKTGEMLVDEAFGIRLQGLFLERHVSKLVRNIIKRPEGRNLVEFKWVEQGDSQITSLRIQPSSLKVDEFIVSSQLLDSLTGGDPIRCDSELLTQYPTYGSYQLNCRSDGELSNRSEEQTYEEGDVRISFSYLPLGNISLIGKPSNGSLFAVEDHDGNYLYMIETGLKSPEELVDSIKREKEKSSSIFGWLSLGLFLLGLFLSIAPFRKAKVTSI